LNGSIRWLRSRFLLSTLNLINLSSHTLSTETV